MALITKEESKRMLDAWFSFYTNNLDMLIDFDNTTDEVESVIYSLTEEDGGCSYEETPAPPISDVYDELAKKYEDNVITLDPDVWDEMDMSSKVTMMLEAYYL